MRKDKRGVEREVLIGWLIAVIILVLILVSYFIISGKGLGMIEYIKNLFRFRGG